MSFETDDRKQAPGSTGEAGGGHEPRQGETFTVRRDGDTPGTPAAAWPSSPGAPSAGAGSVEGDRSPTDAPTVRTEEIDRSGVQEDLRREHDRADDPRAASSVSSTSAPGEAGAGRDSRGDSPDAESGRADSHSTATREGDASEGDAADSDASGEGAGTREGAPEARDDAARDDEPIRDDADRTDEDSPSESDDEAEKERAAAEFARAHDPEKHDITAGEEFRQDGDWTAEDAGGPQVWDADGHLVEGHHPGLDDAPADGAADGTSAGSATGTPTPTATTAGADASAGPAATGAAPSPGPTGSEGRRTSSLEEVEDGGYGVGSAKPIHDGAQPLGHVVIAWIDTRTYVDPGHPAYGDAEPHVWFYDVEAAERAGFRRVD